MKGKTYQISITVTLETETPARLYAKKLLDEQKKTRCKYCDEVYVRQRAHGKYCSHRCQTLAARLRKEPVTQKAP